MFLGPLHDVWPVWQQTFISARGQMFWINVTTFKYKVALFLHIRFRFVRLLQKREAIIIIKKFGHGRNFALRASENLVNFFSLEGRTTKQKLFMWSEVNTIGNSKDLLSKLCVLDDKVDKQTHALETPPKCWNSPPRRQVYCKMIMQIMLSKAVVTCGWCFLGRRPGLPKVANKPHSKHPVIIV